MAEQDADVVPGMAEAIETRRRELGLTVGEMVRRSGLTSPGLSPVRKGIRRRYQDETRFGLAKALDWETDALDRLLAGEAPRPATSKVDRQARLDALELEVTRIAAQLEELRRDG